MSTGFVLVPQMVKSQCTALATTTGKNLPVVVNSGTLAATAKDCLQLSTKSGTLKKAGKFGAIAASVLALGSLITSAFNKNKDDVKSAE